MSRLKNKKLLHLTNLTGSKVIFNAALENGYEYIKHTGDAKFLNRSEFDIIIKDRYPFNVDSIYNWNVPILSLLPGNVFFVQGRNVVLKCVVKKLPFAGSVFLLRSNRYEIVPLDIRLHKLQHRRATFRSVFDEIFLGLHARVAQLLSDPLLITELARLPSIKVTLDRSPIAEFLDNVDFANEPFVDGYDTPITVAEKFHF